MQSTTPAPSVEALIEGDVTGQVAVGSYILQIGSVHGGVVNVAAPAERPVPRPRTTPVRLLPRAFRNLLGREKEVEALTSTLGEGRPAEVSGEQGLGKTALLRHLAHHDAAGAFPDGVVYLSAHRQPAGDLLKLLWDAFYECDVPCVPTPATVREDLAARRAVVLLDDLSVEREEVESLLDAAPGCAFLWTSELRRGVGDARAVALRGLSPEAGARLMEVELGRDLDPHEADAARGWSEKVAGHPVRLLQTAALARDEGLTLGQAIERMAREAAV